MGRELVYYLSDAPYDRTNLITSIEEASRLSHSGKLVAKYAFFTRSSDGMKWVYQRPVSTRAKYAPDTTALRTAIDSSTSRGNGFVYTYHLAGELCASPDYWYAYSFEKPERLEVFFNGDGTWRERDGEIS